MSTAQRITETDILRAVESNRLAQRLAEPSAPPPNSIEQQRWILMVRFMLAVLPDQAEDDLKQRLSEEL
jgi:hypothetical protein